VRDGEHKGLAEIFPIGDMVFRQGNEQGHFRVEQVKDPDGMHQDRLSGQKEELFWNFAVHADPASPRNQYCRIF
jgi:hypothetical protein